MMEKKQTEAKITIYSDAAWRLVGRTVMHYLEVSWSHYLQVLCKYFQVLGGEIDLRAGKPATPPGMSKVARQLPSCLAIFLSGLFFVFCINIYFCHSLHTDIQNCQPYHDIPKPEFSLSGASPGEK